MKWLLIIIIFTAISWNFTWNGQENVPDYVEVWNGNEQIETTSFSTKYEGKWYWWIISGTEFVDYLSYWSNY